MRLKIYMLSTSLFLFATTAHAQPSPPQGMSQEQMQQMMQGAQQMQACFARIGQEPMNRLKERAETMQAEVEKLCAAGRRDEAQATAIRFGKEMSTSDDMQAIKKCGEMASKMMENMPMHSYMNGDEKKQGRKHICEK